MDAAVDRVEDSANADYRSQVEAIRSGWIFAHDDRQYGRWRASAPKPASVLDDQALELAIMNIAQQFPGSVIRGTR